MCQGTFRAAAGAKLLGQLPEARGAPPDSVRLPTCAVWCQTASYCIRICRTVLYCVILCHTMSTVSYCALHPGGLCHTVSEYARHFLWSSIHCTRCHYAPTHLFCVVSDCVSLCGVVTQLHPAPRYTLVKLTHGRLAVCQLHPDLCPESRTRSTLLCTVTRKQRRGWLRI